MPSAAELKARTGDGVAEQGRRRLSDRQATAASELAEVVAVVPRDCASW